MLEKPVKRVTRQVLLDLSHVLLGDQKAKFNLYKEERPLIDEIINYRHYLSLKLDTLLILTHLDSESTRELGKYGTEIFVRILGMDFPQEADVYDIAKYIKLRRICIQNCREADTKEEFFFEDFYYTEPLYFLKIAVYSLIKTDKAIYKEIVLEYMRFLSITPFLSHSKELGLLLRSVLRQAISKYLPAVNFKYTLVKPCKEGGAENFDVFYDPNNTEQEASAKMGDQIRSHGKKKYSYDSLPQFVEITDVFDIQLISILSNFLSVIQSASGSFSFLNDPEVNIFYASLVRHPDIRLKTSALSFFFSQLEDSWYSDSVAEQTGQDILPFPIKLWLPTLISTLNEPELPHIFSPLEMLSRLVTELTLKNPHENIVIDSFFDSNVLNGMIDTFLRLLSLKRQNTDKLQLISNYLKFFSELIGKDERCRLLFLEHNTVLLYMENSFNSHLKLLIDFHENFHILSDLEPLPPFYDAMLVTNWAKCLKSCSRSVGVLRTSLKRNKLAEYTLNLCKEIFLLVNDCYMTTNSELLHQELVLMGDLLGAMSNFVVEFSSLRTLMKKNGIISLIKEIFANPILNAEYLNVQMGMRYEKNNPISVFHAQANIVEQIHIIQTNSLWVLRHLIYNSETCDKLELLTEIDLEAILQFVNVEDPDVLNQCFQLLRNLTCNSRKVINMILTCFKHIEVNYGDKKGLRVNTANNAFLEFLSNKLERVFYDDTFYSDNKIAEGLLYIVVNFTAINENKRNMIIAQDNLLDIVKKFVNVKRGDEVTKACIWIITNLIWDSSIQNAHYTGTMPDTGVHQIEPDWNVAHDISHLSPSDPEDDHETHGDEGSETSAQDDPIGDDHDTAMSEEDENMSEEIGPESEYLRESAISTSSQSVSPAVVRFRKLDRLGFYDVVKKILESNADLDVKERAKTLIYQMENFRKSHPTSEHDQLK